MQPDVKAQEFYQRIGDYSPQTAMEKGLITEEEREYLLEVKLNELWEKT